MEITPNTTNSVFISAFNSQQNTPRYLNPDAPEYIPILLHHANTTTTTTTSSSSLFYFHQNPYPLHPIPYPFIPYQPPLMPFFFHSFIPQNPQIVYPQFIHQLPEQQHLETSQRSFDNVHVSDHGNEGSNACNNNGTRRWSGRLGRRRGGVSIWRVKSVGGRSKTQSNRRSELAESDSNRAILVTTSSGNSSQHVNEEDDDASQWRMVKYKACKKIGKKFEIQLVDESVKKTTVMIRNIPSRYTRDMMLTFLDRHCMDVNLQLQQQSEDYCLSAYDFFYMPMDFKTKLNKSYAFVNFTSPEAVWRFHSKCDSQKWELFASNKIRQIAFAKFQGTGELIEHFGRTAFACDHDEFLPVYFQPPRDGSADADRVISIIGKRVG